MKIIYAAYFLEITIMQLPHFKVIIFYDKDFIENGDIVSITSPHEEHNVTFADVALKIKCIINIPGIPRNRRATVAKIIDNIVA